MKVRDLRVGEIYKLKSPHRAMTHIFTENIRLHPKIEDVKDVREETKKLQEGLGEIFAKA